MVAALVFEVFRLERGPVSEHVLDKPFGGEEHISVGVGTGVNHLNAVEAPHSVYVAVRRHHVVAVANAHGHHAARHQHHEVYVHFALPGRPYRLHGGVPHQCPEVGVAFGFECLCKFVERHMGCFCALRRCGFGRVGPGAVVSLAKVCNVSELSNIVQLNTKN